MTTNSNALFEKQLAFGQIAEGDIAKWIRRRGGYVLPIYDIEYDTGKGPRLFGPNESIVAPDLLVVSKVGVQWIEAKHKTVFSWHRKTLRWVTGIDRHHYRQYLRVSEVIEWPVWLLFLHECNQPNSRDIHGGCPKVCPVGLFGEKLSVLCKCENHQHENHGRHGMVYWAHDKLKQLATLEEIQAMTGPRK